MEQRPRILTGDRTTGRLHLGHYVGSLQNRVQLQDTHDTFVLLADVQALTTHFEAPERVAESLFDVTLDNLSVGLDPERVTFVQQSMVPAIAELTVLYSMLVTVNVLRHNPTIKTEARQYGYDDLTYGFLGYPVSQAADITFCAADLVPVGEDQLPHMEQAHKIVRRFNALYGKGADILKEPKALLSATPRLCGLDGNAKMGKSLNNAIYLSDTPQAVSEKVRQAVTDTGRVLRTDKGNPDVCTVSGYHKAFNPREYEDVCDLCRSAGIGCVACKKRLAECLHALLEPMRARRAHYEANRARVAEIVRDGTARACALGGETARRVKDAMCLKRRA